MKKTRLAIVALLAGLVTLVASPAQAYPDPEFSFTGGSGLDGVVAPGATFTLSGDFGGVDCTWAATFEGQTAGGKGTTFSFTFKAPTKPGKYTGSLVCKYDDGTTPSAKAVAGDTDVTPASYTAASLGEIPQSDGTPFTITVAGAADDADDNADSNGVLPNTGGSNLWLLVAGAALVIAGSGFVVARRRA